MWKLRKLLLIWLLVGSAFLTGLPIGFSPPSVVYASSTTFSVTCTMDQSATQATLSVIITGGTGTSVSPGTALCDGSAHTQTVTYTSLAGASTRIREPIDGATTRDRFSGGYRNLNATCSGSTCTGYAVTNYYELENSIEFTPNSPSTWDAGYGPFTMSGPVDSTTLPTVSLGTITLLSSGGAVTLSNVWTDYKRAVDARPSAFISTVSAPHVLYWTLGPTTLQGSVFVPTTGGNTFNFLFDLTAPTNENFTGVNSGTEREQTAPETLSSAIGTDHEITIVENLLQICGNHTDSNIYCTSGIVTGFTGGPVLNPDCGNCLIANGKFYDFYLNVTDHGAGPNTAIDINVVKFNFTDGFHSIAFGYDNTTRSTKVYGGAGYIDLGVATVTSSRHGSGKYVSLLVEIPVALKTSILDNGAAFIYTWFQLADFSSPGWEVFSGGSYQIVNQGGATTTILHGNATKIAGDSNFACDVAYSGLCSTNATYVGLQHYQTQFSIVLGNKTPGGQIYGLPELWNYQPCFSCGPVNQVAPYEWSIAVTWWNYDNVTGFWNADQRVNISMNYGEWGSNDQWTAIQVLWYQGLPGPGPATFVLEKNDSTVAWIEEGPTPNQPGTFQGQVRLYLDMWLSSQNFSTIHGGNVGVYYTGMSSSGWLWWTSWAPKYQNATESLSYAQNLGAKDVSRVGIVTSPISAQQMLCSKIQFTVSRPKDYPLGFGVPQGIYKYFHIYTTNFAVEKFDTTPNIARDGGIGTPQLTAAQIPNLPQGSFFGPLIAIVESLAGLIWKAITGGLNAIWSALGSQFPWFTGFWSAVGSGILAFFSFFLIIIPALTGFLNLLYQGASFVTIPFQIIGAAWGTLTGMFSVFNGVNITQILELIVIVYFGGTIGSWAESGNYGAMLEFTKRVWNVADRIMFWTYNFVKAIIDAFMGLIP